MNNIPRICCILNVAPHYREAIYKLIDTEMNADFYIGDRIGFQIKLMNYNELRGFKSELKFIHLFKSVYYHSLFLQYFIFDQILI